MKIPYGYYLNDKNEVSIDPINILYSHNSKILSFKTPIRFKIQQ